MCGSDTSGCKARGLAATRAFAPSHLSMLERLRKCAHRHRRMSFVLETSGRPSWPSDGSSHLRLGLGRPHAGRASDADEVLQPALRQPFTKFANIPVSCIRKRNVLGNPPCKRGIDVPKSQLPLGFKTD